MTSNYLTVVAAVACAALAACSESSAPAAAPETAVLPPVTREVTGGPDLVLRDLSIEAGAPVPVRGLAEPYRPMKITVTLLNATDAEVTDPEMTCRFDLGNGNPSVGSKPLTGIVVPAHGRVTLTGAEAPGAYAEGLTLTCGVTAEPDLESLWSRDMAVRMAVPEGAIVAIDRTPPAA